MVLEIPGYTYHENGYYTMEPSSSQVKRDLRQRVEVGSMLTPVDPAKYPTVWGEKRPIGQQLSAEALVGLAESLGKARETATQHLTDIRQYNTLREYRETIRETFTQAPAPAAKALDLGGLLGGIGIGAGLVALLLVLVGMGKK